MGSTAAMTNVGLVSVANQSNITGLGTISSGTWQSTPIASAYLDPDTAHLTTNQTFTGNKTFTGTVTTGVDDTGVDVKFFGASAGAYMLWDESADTLEIRGKSNFKSSAKDILITSQLRTALIINKKIKSGNYTLETIDKKIYIFGISMDLEEKQKVIEEANEIYGVKEIIPTIYLVEDLSRNKN